MLQDSFILDYALKSMNKVSQPTQKEHSSVNELEEMEEEEESKGEQKLLNPLLESCDNINELIESRNDSSLQIEEDLQGQYEEEESEEEAEEDQQPLEIVNLNDKNKKNSKAQTKNKNKSQNSVFLPSPVAPSLSSQNSKEEDPLKKRKVVDSNPSPSLISPKSSLSKVLERKKRRKQK